MGYTLLMSTEIRDWLAELCDTDPPWPGPAPPPAGDRLRVPGTAAAR
jgi:hypothetical protein